MYDWKQEREDKKIWGNTIPYTEDFLPEFEGPSEAPEPTPSEPSAFYGQDALELWAAQTKSIREGEVPAIHRHSNSALRETALADVRCPNCGCEFAATASTK
jgi:hypothetical protein